MDTPNIGAPTLEWALWYASQGFRVFPLRRNGKLPAIEGWQDAASADVTAVAELWGKHPGANVGVYCKGLCVLDIDVKDGFDGRPAFAALGAPATLATSTASGGEHHYFRADSIRNRRKAFEGIDVRGDGGFVVGAGSHIDGRHYALTVAAPVADLPANVRELLGRAKDYAEQPSSLLAADTPNAVVLALQWLRDAPPAVAGHGGNTTTYEVARLLKRAGVSAGVALGMMLEVYNPRCVPPWSETDLRVTVTSAYRSSEPLGIGNPLSDFGAVPEAQGLSAELIFAAPRLQPVDIKPRPWIVRNVLLEGSVTALVGPGGVGKSLWQIYLAICTATGDGSKIGEKIEKPRNVLIINNEDDAPEMYRRYYSACKALDVDPATLVGKVFLFSGVGKRFRAVVRNKDGKLEATPVMAEMLLACQMHDVGAIFCDPFVSMHDGDENSASDVNDVMGKFIHLATTARIAVLISHHTRKPSASSSEGYAGDANSGRGSSALPAATRVLLTMYAPSAADCKKRGIPEEARRDYVMLDDGKTNYGPYGKGKWFKKAVHDVPGLPEAEVFLSIVAEGKKAATTGVEVPDAEASEIAAHVQTLLLTKGAADVNSLAKDIQPLRDEWAAMDRRVFQGMVASAVGLSPQLSGGYGDDNKVRLRN